MFEERYSCDSLPADAGDDDSDACAETLTRVVRRPAQYQDDAALPARFGEQAGARIYAGLRDGFRGEQFNGPPPARAGASLDELLAGAKRLLQIFEEKGYCLKAEISDVVAGGDGGDDLGGGLSSGGGSGSSGSGGGGSGGGGTFTVTINGPATLWGLRALATQNAAIANAHDALALAAYFEASGRACERELELTDTGYVERWRVF